MIEIFSWNILATFAGKVIATAIVTQFLKEIFSKIPTPLISYVVALLLILVTIAVLGEGAEWTEWVIAPLNAILVSLAANGKYDAIARFTANKSEANTDSNAS